jgi:glutathione synthase/RimK-type ligase-like ATP-grasp enzyme
VRSAIVKKEKRDMPKIAILTEEKYVNPRETNWYMDQVLFEDRLLSEALRDLDVEVEKVAWSDASVNWKGYDAAIFSSIWDYYRRPKEFTVWLDRVEGQTFFYNSVSQIQKNMDKRYLVELFEDGHPVVPSLLLERGTAWNSSLWAGRFKVEEFAIKPVVGGAAYESFRWRLSDPPSETAAIREVLEIKDMILQPFLPSIMEEGEVSHIVFGGDYSHSILKRPKAGDYRVQDDFGGSVHEYTATEKERAIAEHWVAQFREQPVYARVDLVRDASGNWVLGEMELIEPELWLRKKEGAADSFARAVMHQFHRDCQ